MEEQQRVELSKIPLVSCKNVLEYIKTLEFNDSEGILFLEQQLYNLLQKLPQDSNLLTLLMYEQIMNSRGQRARSIAYKIWETGGILEPEIELIYLDGLINLGLGDMAGAALTPYLSDLENNIERYGGLFVKYALFSGNMLLLEKLLPYLPDDKNSGILRDLLDLHRELQVNADIPQIMKRIEDNVREAMLGFGYNLFSDREFPEVEFIFYVDETIKDYKEMRNKIHLQISAYCANRKIDDLINLSVVIRPIQRQRRSELLFLKR